MKEPKVYRPYGVVVLVKRGRRYLFLNDQGKPVAVATARRRDQVWDRLFERGGQVVELGPRLRRGRNANRAEKPSRPSFHQYMTELGCRKEIVARIPPGLITMRPVTEEPGPVLWDGLYGLTDEHATHALYLQGEALALVVPSRRPPEFWIAGNDKEGYVILWYDCLPVTGPEIGLASRRRWKSAAAARDFLAAAGRGTLAA